MAAFFNDKLGGCSCARSKCSDECSAYRNFKPKTMTNADCVRAMTDEELARWIARQVTEGGTIVSEQRIKWWLDWLKSPVEVEDERV